MGEQYGVLRRAAAADLLTDYFAENPTYEKAFGFMFMDHGIDASGGVR